MWLRRLVGTVLIITLLGMNVIAIIGLFASDKNIDPTASNSTLSQKPTVSLSVEPGAISAGTTTALSWSTTGNPSSCTATGSWEGVKTPFGAESSGRITNPGDYTYTLTCLNQAGNAEATVSLNVSKGVVTAQKQKTSTGTSPSTSQKYCSGRVPCYNANDISSHGSKNNCWGWLGDRVINVSGFDAGFHVVRSGVRSIEQSDICGKDLMPAVSGKIPGDGYSGGHDHGLGAKSSTDKNYLSYFVGYFDATKP